MADEPNYQPEQAQLMGTDEQVPQFAYSEQQRRRAGLAVVRIGQELRDVKAQGAVLGADDAAEIRGLLDDVSPTANKAGKPIRGTKS
jgi:hypothetical protein